MTNRWMLGLCDNTTRCTQVLCVAMPSLTQKFWCPVFLGVPTLALPRILLLGDVLPTDQETPAPSHSQWGCLQSIADSRAYHKIKLWGKPLEPRDLTETLERRRPSRRLRLARGSEPASVPFSRNALYYLSQEKRGSSTCLKSKLEELEGDEASSSKGRMRAQRRAPGNLSDLRGVIRRSCTNIKNEQI